MTKMDFDDDELGEPGARKQDLALHTTRGWTGYESHPLLGVSPPYSADARSQAGTSSSYTTNNASCHSRTTSDSKKCLDASGAFLA